MARTPNLSTIVQKERKFIHMAPGRVSLKPKGTRTVQLNDGSFATIDDEPVFYETEGEHRMSMYGRYLDEDIPKDKLVLDCFEAMLAKHPWMATDVRYQFAILGEFQAVAPWNGYDGQDAADARNTFLSLPDSARPKLEEMMKYEMTRVEYDEDLDEEVSITNDDKIKMINDLHRELERREKADAEGTVDLA